MRQTVVVQVPPARAFEIFAERTSSWWPLETHSVGAKPVVAAVLEPRVGGRAYNRSEDGSECGFGRVVAWEPPHRLVLAWELSIDWRHDPAIASEVEIRFHPVEGGGTRVELEHRGLDVYGEHAQGMRDTFDSPGGWPAILGAFAVVAGRGEEPSR